MEFVEPGDPAVGLPTLWRVTDETAVAFAKIWRDDPVYPEVKARNVQYRASYDARCYDLSVTS